MLRAIFEQSVFIYGCTLLFMYALLAYMSYRGIIRFRKKNSFTNYDYLLDSR